MKRWWFIVFALASVSALAPAAESVSVLASIALSRSESGSYGFIVRNIANKPIFYHGYGSEEGTPPVYSVQILKDGEWRDDSIGWCGVGLGKCPIRALGSIGGAALPGTHFKILSGERFRIVMRFTSQRSDETPTWTTTHSNPVVFIPTSPNQNLFLRMLPKNG